MLKQLAGASSLPWCIIGDFNDLLTADEKEGRISHPRTLLDGFAEIIMECGLNDLGFTGGKFTWEHCRGTERWVSERLDRGFATESWSNLFPDAEVIVHEVTTSDHIPLCLKLNKQMYVPRLKRFRFENMWVQKNECRGIVQECWSSVGGCDIMKKMARCCARLEEWGGGHLKQLKNKLWNCRKHLQRLRSRRDSVGVCAYKEARENYL